MELEDGSMLYAKESRHLEPGMCLTVEIFEGHFGVRWIEFAPHADKDNRVKQGNCFDGIPLEYVRHH